MTHLLSRRWTILIFILFSLLAIIACQPGAAVSTSAAGTRATTEGPLTVEVVFGPGPFNLPAPTVGLSDLNSYKATLTLSFDGTKAEQTRRWSKTYIMLNTKEPVARQLTLEKTGDLSDLDALVMAEVNGAAYERRGEKGCNAIAIDSENSLAETWEPAGFLTGVIGAEKAGSETVNGVAADHYTFDERAFGELGVTQSTGEMWVASKGGYLLKYLLTTKGDANYFGGGIEGMLTWDYELTDTNQPLAVELPKDCPAGMVDAPLLPDAADLLNMPGLVTYTTRTSLADAAAFYQQQLPTLGWQPTADPAIDGVSALMDFTRADQQLSVIITTGDEGTTVHIVVGPIQP